GEPRTILSSVWVEKISPSVQNAPIKLKYETNIGIDRKLILRTDESLRDTQSRSGFFLHDARRIRAEIGQLRFQRVHHRWWSAQVEVLVEIAYLRFQEIFGDKTVCMAGDIFFGKNINEVSSQEAVKFFFENDIFFRLVGEYEPVIADFTFGFQETNNGNEWGYACTARDKYALTTVFDSTEDIIQDERIARRKCPQFVSHALP